MVLGLVAGLMAPLQSQQTVRAESQDSEVMDKYKNMKTLAADVTMTRHNIALAKDQISKGKFYFKKPDAMVMTFNNGKDMLLMKDGKFTMVSDGKAATASGSNSQLDALKTMFTSFTTGQESDVQLEDVADVDAERDGDILTMTITPRISDPKERRKMLYQSYVVVINTKVGDLNSIRLNEKGKNYTQYNFSNFKFDGPVDDAVFTIKK